tara:strand:- start:212 stop:409 length:198 start_codon:yes stop_codon:yes gene_type:complete
MTTFQLVAVTSRGTQVPLIRVVAASKDEALKSREAVRARSLQVGVLANRMTVDAIPTNPSTESTQ